MSFISGLQPGDRVRITVIDTDSGETETLTATVRIAGRDLLAVRPDDTIMGLATELIIRSNELLALEKITSGSASSLPARPPSD